MKKIFLILLGLILVNDSFCQVAKDAIYKIDRTVLEARIDSLSDYEVFYFEPLSPEAKKSLRLTMVWKIVFSNGFEEMFNEPLPEEVVNPKEDVDETNPDLIQQDEIESDSLHLLPKESYVFIPEEESEKKKFSDAFKDIHFFVDNRPVLALRFGLYAPILVSEDSWVSTNPNEGLGLRLGYGSELGLDFNFHQLLGVSLVSGITGHQTSISYLDLEGNSILEQNLSLRTIPTKFQLRFYPLDGFSLSGGIVFNSMSLSDGRPRLDNAGGTGFTFGFAKLSPMGRKKNLFELSMNYTSVGMNDPYSYTIGIMDERVPMSSFELGKLGYVDVKFSFLFGLLK